MAAPVSSEANPLIAPSELARRAGVTKKSIWQAMGAKLRPACVGRELVADYPLVLAYIARHQARPKRLKGTRGRPSATEHSQPTHNPLLAPTAPSDSVAGAPNPVLGDDPLARASAIAQAVGAPLEQHTNAVLHNLQTQTAGQLPADVEDLGRITLRELVDLCGTFEAVQARRRVSRRGPSTRRPT